MAATETVVLNEKRVNVAVSEFSDYTMVTVSDGAVFGPMFKVVKNQKANNDPIITIDGLFGEAKDYLQVVARHLSINCPIKQDMLASILLQRELVTKNNMDILVQTVTKLLQ